MVGLVGAWFSPSVEATKFFSMVEHGQKRRIQIDSGVSFIIMNGNNGVSFIDG